MNNEKEKTTKWGGEKLGIQKLHNAKRCTKLIRKIREVARGIGPLSWNWGVPHFDKFVYVEWTNYRAGFVPYHGIEPLWRLPLSGNI